MEVRAMEKTWETFMATGKVTDYLTYRNERADSTGEGKSPGQKEQQIYEAAGDSDGHGFDSHACQ